MQLIKYCWENWESNTNKKQITKLKKLEKKYEMLPDQLLILTLKQKLQMLPGFMRSVTKAKTKNQGIEKIFLSMIN